MHFGDTIFIFALALIIFGPKKLPEIGRQIGKLMVEFRRASNDFKLQIEEELRSAEQAERQKALAAQAAKDAAAAPPAEAASVEPSILPPSEGSTVSQGTDVETASAEEPLAEAPEEDAAVRSIAELADNPAIAAPAEAIATPAAASQETEEISQAAAELPASPNAERYYQNPAGQNPIEQNPSSGAAGQDLSTHESSGAVNNGIAEAAHTETADDQASIHHV